MRYNFIVLAALLLSTRLSIADAPEQLHLTSPAAFQVFQRDAASNLGVIWISGSLDNWDGSAYTIRAHWRGLDSDVLWQGDSDTFDANWPEQPTGQGDLTITIADTVTTIPVVSVGDVYVIAGQSNAVGAGTHFQTYMNTLGLRAGMLTYQGWRELADPTGQTPGHLIQSGSAWPLLASYILDSGIPVAFVPTSVGGTHIQRWQPGQDLYRFLSARVDSLPPPYARAVLWQQGETNTDPAAVYAKYLTKLAASLDAQYGLPLLAAYLYNNPAVNDGIDRAVQGRSSVLHGADLRGLPPEDHHYHTDLDLQAEAWLWWQSLVSNGFYSGEPYLSQLIQPEYGS